MLYKEQPKNIQTHNIINLTVTNEYFKIFYKLQVAFFAQIFPFQFI